MLKEGLSYFTDTHITLIGLALFMILFIGIIFWTRRQSTNEIYSQLSELPLQNEGEHK